ncbi:hypothetical protein JCM1840_000417 [Sporobolomyces johnsonii]
MLFTQRDQSPTALSHAVHGLSTPAEPPVLTCIAPSVLETHNNLSISPSALFSVQTPPSPSNFATFDPYFPAASTGADGDSKPFAIEPFSPPPTGGGCPYATPVDYAALFASCPFAIDTGLPSRLPSPVLPTPSPTTSDAALLPPELLGASANTVTVGQILESFSTASGSTCGSSSTCSDRRTSFSDFEGEQSLVDSGIGLSSRVKPFIGKLFHLLSHPESYRDVIVWDEQGLAFICHHGRRFTSEVLPQLFGHGNVSSFTRQLNVYGFTRLTASDLLARLDVASTQDYSGWSHPQFRRDNGKGALHLLSPRPSRARLRKKAEKQRAQLQTAEDNASTSAVATTDRSNKRPRIPPPLVPSAAAATAGRHPRTRTWSATADGSSDSSGSSCSPTSESVAYTPSSTSSSVSTLRGGTRGEGFEGLGGEG